MINNITKRIYKNDLSYIVNFAERISQRSDKVTKRSKKLIDAYIEGKLAEVGVAKFFRDRFDWDIDVDMEVYAGEDRTDILGLDHPIEVKKTKMQARNVAIAKKFYKKLEDNEVIVQTKMGFESNHPFDIEEASPVRVKIYGWCFPDDLSLTKQGEKPWTQNTDNYCIKIDDMNDDWDRFPEIVSEE